MFYDIFYLFSRENILFYHIFRCFSHFFFDFYFTNKLIMNFKQIQQLIKFVSKTDVAEVNIENNNFKINIKGSKSSIKEPSTPSIQQPSPPQIQTVPQVEVRSTQIPIPKLDENLSSNDSYKTIKSPIIGTFYRKPSPDKDVFVNVGDTVGEGDVLCVIEAMKLFNEIESDTSGKIVKILVEDASPVEFDQPLFLIEP